MYHVKIEEMLFFLNLIVPIVNQLDNLNISASIWFNF